MLEIPPALLALMKTIDEGAYRADAPVKFYGFGFQGHPPAVLAAMATLGGFLEELGELPPEVEDATLKVARYLFGGPT